MSAQTAIHSSLVNSASLTRLVVSSVSAGASTCRTNNKYNVGATLAVAPLHVGSPYHTCGPRPTLFDLHMR